MYTIGHSTRKLDEFVNLLTDNGVKTLVDVRSFPGSSAVPQFNYENLAQELPKHGIKYIHLKILGGRRRTTAKSMNGAWRNKAFRGYADYMQTDEFRDGLQQLETIAKESTTAIMCAEAVPWRCHRSLIGDALLVRKWKVLDIISTKKVAPHKLTPFARVSGTKSNPIVTYPA